MHRRDFIKTVAYAASGAVLALGAGCASAPGGCSPGTAATLAAPMLTLNNGVRIPLSGYGVSGIADSQGQRTMEEAPASGYRLIDTAAAYRNEAEVGAAIRASGVSNFGADLLRELHQHHEVKPALNQIRLNPLEQQAAMRQAMQALGVAAQSYSPLGGSRSSQNLLEHPMRTALDRQHGKTPAQIALRWLVQQGIVAIPKTTRKRRMAENLAIFDFTLGEPGMQRMAALAQ